MGAAGSVPVRFAVLGPVRAWRAGVEIDLGPPQQKAALAVLLVRAGQAVGLREIIDVLWRDDPPASAVNVVHRSVGRLRRLLEPDLPMRAAGSWVVRAGGGYRLDVGRETNGALVDLLQFRELRAKGRQAVSADEAITLLLAAVELWQGPCAAGTEPEVRAHPLFAAVDREYLAAVEELADVALRRGAAERVLPVVHAAAAGNEWDEQLQAKLVLTLAATGRQAEALAVYAQARSRLNRELGIDPGPELRAAHERVLRQQLGDDEAPAEPVPAGPATAAPMVRPAQLPADLPTFTGRVAELNRARALLADPERVASSLVIGAIDGMAGIGKTTLAVHWAHEVADRFPDGQLYVNLRGFDPGGAVLDPADAVRGFLEGLGVPPKQVPAGLPAQAALYRSLLAGRRMLILLDNARDAEQVRPLLPGSAGCLVIVTSRNRPDSLIAADGAHPLTLDLLSVNEARTALESRLGAGRIAAEPEAVDEIIDACGRLPLALAVVAARAAAHPDFPLSAFAAELRDAAGSLEAFSDGGAGTDARAVFSWSYQTLSPEAARLFRLLSLHPGPDVSAAAVASLSGTGPRQTRPPLAELTRAHLLTERLPGRYAFHDLLRAYATELTEDLDSETDRRAAVSRVLDHYLHSALAVDKVLSPHREPIPQPARSPGVTPVSPDGAERAGAWLNAEYAVLLAAIRRAAHDGFERHAWQLTWAIQPFFDRSGRWYDWADAQHLALAAARAASDREGLAYAHRGWGILNSRRNRNEESRAALERALRLFEEQGNIVEQAHVHMVLGSVLSRIPHHETEGMRHTEECLRLYRAAEHRIGQAWALNNLGFFASQGLGDHAMALDYCQQALVVHQELGDVHGEANAWDSIAFAHAQLGNHDEAIAGYRHALELHTVTGDRYYLSATLVRLGDAHHDAGEDGAAREVWERALATLTELDHPDAASVQEKLGRYIGS
jgi:DNA-binding SARP family transcriptional activator/tetratricopeptide (TPR) repeat protein